MATYIEGEAELSRAASVRSWKSRSVREIWQQAAQPDDVFSRNSTTKSDRNMDNNNNNNNGDDEEELMWAAIERLPTYDRVRKGMVLTQVNSKGKRIFGDEVVDVTKLGTRDKKLLIDSVLKIVENDNEKLLTRIRDRVDRVGIQIPSIEVRFENLRVEGDAYLGTRALPTLLNTTLNAMEFALSMIGLSPSKKRVVKILQDVTGIIRPSRLTLLLGPPASGKTTFLKTLAGKANKDLRIQGRITYCGHEFSEFVPQRTSAYISQHDVHFSEMTVRETLDFAGRCMGVGTKYDMLVELARREKERGVKPDPEIDAFMKATAVSGQKTSLTTDYVLKILGLDICADIMIGDAMIRGISGGQKKRVTTGEMLVGPAKAFFMDEISTGLDSATTFQIVKFMNQMVHINDITMVISLLQPPPETFELFDDVILLSDGRIVYQGPREPILEFFEYVGFKCPERKGIADFLQEVTSIRDQEQYWFRKNQPYRYITAEEFEKAFSSFHIGQQLSAELKIPYDKSKMHPAALVNEKYGISRKELFRACFARQWLLMKRIWVLHIFKMFQITLMSILAMSVFFRTQMKAGGFDDASKFFGALFYGLINVMFNGMGELILTVLYLPTFYKQRDSLFYPGWAYGLPIWLLSIPTSVIESVLWTGITYYTIGFAPAASRFFKQLLAFIGVHQMAIGLFRFIGAAGRSIVVSNTVGMFGLLVVLVLGGFIVAKDDLKAWMVWGYYASPMTYGQNAIAMNEFLDERWATPTYGFTSEATVGKTLLKDRGLFAEEYLYWVSIVALFGFTLLLNLLFVAALTFLNPLGDTKSIPCDQDGKNKRQKQVESNSQGVQMAIQNGVPDGSSSIAATENESKRGMVLPFQPLSLAFSHVNYYVDMPVEMKARGFEEDRLQLLRNVSGAFRPGVLTALVGISGAGKSTLMDVLAGRKTGGYIEGSINISGYPKNQETFARVCGYCEQNDIHSPYLTVYESLLFSSWLRLPMNINTETRKMFVEEVMGLVELGPLRSSLVGLPGVDGLSTEQRKRLTIAVELVANPSIIFMDEPTSGLDARAAAIVMRTVRNIGNTGRTIVCTIHQPSIDIFESFDELLLMKRGGLVIYAGDLGHHSQKLIEYFEAIPGVPKIKEGYNPATWMLDISTVGMETQLGVDFAEIYESSELYSKNQELIKELSTPEPGSKDLYFPTKYSQPYLTQFRACLWKKYWSYWRDSKFNVSRFGMTIVIGLLFGAIFWDKGGKIYRQQDLQNVLGAIYSAVFFLGITNASAVQSVVSTERTVYYRERAAGMYSAMPYAISQVVMEAFYVAIQTLIYTLMLYSMIGFQWTPEKFFYFYFFIFASYAYCSYFGMMLVGLTPALGFAGIIMSFFVNFWNLFAGFILPRLLIPIWWRWYYWCSPVAWTIYGLLTSQLGDRTEDVEVLGRGKMPIHKYLKDTYGFDHDFLIPVVFAHVGWIVLFVGVYAYAMKVLNFQKR